MKYYNNPTYQSHVSNGTIRYAPSDKELSLSNGRGIDNPLWDRGNIDCYTWSENSSFAEKIYQSDAFTANVVKKIFEVVDLTLVNNAFALRPDRERYVVCLHDLDVGLNFSGGASDLHYALGHCTARLDEVRATIKMGNDGSLLLTGFSVSGVCVDLYDFNTEWNSEYTKKLSNAAFIVQNCHKYGVRNEGEVFRVVVDLSCNFSRSQGLSWGSQTVVHWTPDN